MSSERLWAEERPAMQGRARAPAWKPLLRAISEEDGIELEIGLLKPRLLQNVFGGNFAAVLPSLGASIVTNIEESIVEGDERARLLDLLATTLQGLSPPEQWEGLYLNLLAPALQRPPVTGKGNAVAREWKDRYISAQTPVERRASAPVKPTRGPAAQFLRRSLSVIRPA